MPEAGKLLETERLRLRLLAQDPGAIALVTQLEHRVTKGDSSAFAPIRHGRCQACHLKVSAVDLQHAKLGDFVNCKHCSRFLYEAGQIE